MHPKSQGLALVSVSACVALFVGAAHSAGATVRPPAAKKSKPTLRSKGDEAPGAPGIPHRWAPALKQAIGAAYEKTGAQSPVWFTMAEGVLTEVAYPRVDQPQTGDLQFLVTDGDHFFSEQRRDTRSQVLYAPQGQTVQVTSMDRSGKYRLDQQIVTDPQAPVVRIQSHFQWQDKPLRVFVLFKPAINNLGALNQAIAQSDALLATRTAPLRARGDVLTRHFDPASTALLSSVPYTATSAGYVGTTDGWQDISRNFQLTRTWGQAGPGNVALVAELAVPQDSHEFTVDLALAFAPTPGGAINTGKNSLQTPFEVVRQAYEAGWASFLTSLDRVNGKLTFFQNSPQARRSAVVMKMHEDKIERGAIVASLSKPGVPDGDHAQDAIGGYHLVWPRDIYHTAMGLMAAGDRDTPVRVLRFLRRIQSDDGSWPQNFWIDGTPYWKGLQLDEVAFPILLAYHLQKRGLLEPTAGDLEMVRRAARFLVDHGPVTPQDRWEENGGYVPSTVAPVISALRAASRLTGDSEYRETAETWATHIEDWMRVRQGAQGRNYYLRVSPTGHPDNREPLQIANGGGQAFADEILDGGFLELVRQGVRPANDPVILSTLRIYESPRLGIAGGFEDPSLALHYRRYNRDGYGENNVGGYWPLLAGERGMYALIAGDTARATAQLQLMESTALPSGLIPEQTITATNRAIAGPGVACPLVWAHSEDILLRRSLEEGVPFDAP